MISVVVGGIRGFVAAWAAMRAQFEVVGIGATWIRLTIFWTYLTSLRISFRLGSLAAASWQMLI